MKPILLLGPAEPGGPPTERWLVELRPITPDEGASAAADYSSVIVINDGGAETVARLVTALRLRQQRPLRFVGVLSYLDLEPALRIELRKEGLTLEYQEA